MSKFENELTDLEAQLSEMSQLAISMVDLAVSAVHDRTRDVHDDVAGSEAMLDQMQSRIDNEAIRLLTVYGPVASSLRQILVVTHMTAQLERIGDQVMNVDESLKLIASDRDQPTLSRIHEMADTVRLMVDNAVKSYFDRDIELAEATRAEDDLVDASNLQVMQLLLSDDVVHSVLTGEKDIRDSLAQMLIARHLERIADQAVNICKEVAFMVQGEDVRHRTSTPDIDER